MGAAFSPTLCNLYLCMYERAALLRLSRLIQDPTLRSKVLAQWEHFFRYTEDAGIINGPDLESWVAHPRGQGLLRVGCGSGTLEGQVAYPEGYTQKSQEPTQLEIHYQCFGPHPKDQMMTWG